MQQLQRILGLLVLWSQPIYVWGSVDTSDPWANVPNYDTAAELNMDNHACYSCMSEFYRDHWSLLKHFWNEPKNFSDSCAFVSETEQSKTSGKPRIGTVKCDSVCVKIIDDISISGVVFAGHIRGCYDNLLKNGFNSAMLNWYTWNRQAPCNHYLKKEILKLSTTHPETTIEVCTCLGDRCNQSNQSIHSLSTILLSLFMFLYSILCSALFV